MTTALVRGGLLVGAEHRRADVVVDARHIVAIDPSGDGRADWMLDATGCSVLPGFVDVQVNGAAGADLTTQPARIGHVAAFLPQMGVTSFMPTVISSPLDDITAAIAIMHEWSTDPRSADALCARSLGVHVEGPFLNPIRRGAHPEHHLREPSVDAVRGWRRDTGVSMVTIAPELPNALDVITHLAERDVVVCAGHTDADASTLDDAARLGVRGVTHLFNAMGVMSARSSGVAGATLTHSGLIAGLIVDGLHVDPLMVQLAWRMLGPSRVALVSDCMAALGLPHGTYAIGDSPVVVGSNGARTEAGVLAGSVLRFDGAVRGLMDVTGCGLDEAAQAAAATPARLAGRGDIGRLTIGCLADIVLIDDARAVVATMVGGRVAWDPQQRWSRWKS